MPNFFKRRGAAMLPVVMILGGVIIEITVASAFVAYSVSQIGLGERLSSEALSAARSGAMDAIARVLQDKDFYDTDGYSLTVGNRTASIVITKDYPSVGQTRIVSTGTALIRQKKIQVDLAVDSTTGETNIISFEEINL